MRILNFVFAGCLAVTVPAIADDSPTKPSNPVPDGSMPYNIPMSTLGGQQFWSDVLHFHKWRIQENAITGHFRLLDPKNVRQAWGTLADCHGKLQEIKQQQNLQPMRGHVVLVLHGLGRGWSKMDTIAQFLEQNGFTVCNISYASTRRDLDDHARTLKSVIDNLPDVEEIDIVGHSLGNIVTRRFLHEVIDEQGRCQDPRLKRMVMLGPPNQGARMASVFGDSALFSIVTGKSGRALGVDWKAVESQLPAPPFEFGIIAGTGTPYTPPNPLISGPNDFLVSVEEARLPGAADFLVLPTNHASMTEDQIVLDALLSFLKHGYFVAADKKQPIGPGK